jgi:GT2 family glycosyltransferase
VGSGVAMTADAGGPCRTTVVVATMDRRDELLATLGRLTSLPDRPPVIVIDNGSADGSPDAVEERFPSVRLVRAGRNLGATARNVGVSLATTPYVAFSDDDSWWAPGALHRAAAVFDASPRLGVLMARVLVGPEERLDPVCAEMAASPLPRPDHSPGPALLGFIACGAVVRRQAFLDVGGFDDLVFFLGEEQVLSLDLATAGWALAYVEDVVAHHHPSPVRNPAARRVRQTRNDLLSTWMRRPGPVVAGRTTRLLAAATDPAARRALGEAMVRLPEAVRRRRVVPADIEAQIRLLEA